MAYWKIPFQSVNGTDYVVRILGADEDTELIGSAEPITTQEDDNDDLFTPVRTQSGYVRFVDVNDEWEKIFPTNDTSRHMSLEQDGDVIWRGYLQPQTFQGDLFIDTQERELPIMCPVSILEGVDVRTDILSVKTFAFLLNEIFANTGYDWNFVFPGTPFIVKEWLSYCIDWTNFLDVKSDSVESNYNYLELLEEVCKFFGWTCRTHKDTVYFVAPDDESAHTYSQFTAQDLANIDHAQGISIGALSTVDFNGDIYASTNNVVSLVQGIRECTVVADINKKDIVVDVPLNEVYERNKLNNVTVFHYGANGIIFTLLDPQYAAQRYEFEDMVIKASGGSINYGGNIKIKEYYEGNVGHKHNYSWTPYIEIRGAGAGISYCTSLASKHPHNYDHGAFVISASVAHRFVKDGKAQIKNAQGTLTCQLRIGSKWWNGAGWVSTKPSGGFAIPIGSEEGGAGDGAGQIFNNRELNGIYNEYNGHGIPIADPIGGIVELQILDVSLEEDYGYGETIEITNIKMEFVREKAYAHYDEKDENEYKRLNSSSFRDKREIKTIFATDNNNAFGLGIIIAPTGAYAKKIRYEYLDGYAEERPELRLTERVANFYAHTRKIREVEVLHNKTRMTPLHCASFGTKESYPIAISNDWRRNIATIKLIEL